MIHSQYIYRHVRQTINAVFRFLSYLSTHHKSHFLQTRTIAYSDLENNKTNFMLHNEPCIAIDINIVYNTFNITGCRLIISLIMSLTGCTIYVFTVYVQLLGIGAYEWKDLYHTEAVLTPSSVMSTLTGKLLKN